jgi:hypothetical protein
MADDTSGERVPAFAVHYWSVLGEGPPNACWNSKHARKMRFDLSEREAWQPGTNSPKLPWSPPATPIVLACQRAHMSSIGRKNTCGLLLGCR